ncbi:ead/Ea22-like family protein [Escherichia sp. E4385]|uniref:ead/Ea22-like family protein n=1 Tax=Escherichia sp. E4385 TaxID=2040639 RepID=UPI00197AD8D5|nr:ead/Ea22-like family protein [Escherichia sp. E4385]
MSKINYQVLREIAKQATQGEWVAFISTGTGTYAVHTPGDKRCEDVIKWTGFDGQKNAENNARYIAAFNPAVVQALLDEREAQSKRIAEMETNLAALAAENARLKVMCEDRRRFIMKGVQLGYIKVPKAETDPDLETIRIAISPQKPIPATDAFLAEVRAQGVEMMREHPSIKLCSLTHICDELAAQLRKGELHMMFDAGIHIKGEEHGNKTRR